jgi:hypothetical protein
MSAYLTAAEADIYFADHLNAGLWLTATTSDKDKALAMSTRLIDTLNYRGSKTDPDQENQFPRGENSYTPLEVGWACAEIALRYLEGFNPTKERENLVVTSERIDSISSSYDGKYKEQWRMSGVPSIEAWNYLLPFLAGKTTISFLKA